MFPLRFTIIVIVAFQVLLGFVFLFFPGPFAALMGLDPAPAWVPWMFAMFTARAWGFAAGLVLAFRDPLRYRSWLVIMAGVQAIDWIATIAYLLQHAVTLAQVATASFLPVVFIVALVLTIPRGRGFDHDGVVREVAA
jgi:hypothetical protein